VQTLEQALAEGERSVSPTRAQQRRNPPGPAGGSTRLANLDKALRLLRERHGFSQGELAAALGISFSTVSSWERGTRVPSLPTLGAIADRLDVDLGDLDRALDIVNGRPPAMPRGEEARPIELRQMARQLAGGGGVLASADEEAILGLLEAIERTFQSPEGDTGAGGH